MNGKLKAYMSIIDEEELISGELQIGQHRGLTKLGNVLLVGEEGFLDATVVGNVLG